MLQNESLSVRNEDSNIYEKLTGHWVLNHSRKKEKTKSCSTDDCWHWVMSELEFIILSVHESLQTPPQRKNKTWKECSTRSWQAMLGWEEATGRDQELRTYPKRQLAIGSRWYLSGNVSQRLPNFGIFIFKRSWNPGCLLEISCPLMHIFKNKVQAKENMLAGWIWSTDCKAELRAAGVWWWELWGPMGSESRVQVQSQFDI